MTLRDALALGRVSNLPTVWTNVLATIVLVGGSAEHPALWWLLIGLTLFYVSGMYLNDYFDAAIDAAERPERPIPSGRVSRRAVGVCGSAMMVAAVGIVAVAAFRHAPSIWPVAAALALAACIVGYNVHHKANPWSPFIMGLCRLGVYLCAGLSVVMVPPGILLVALIVVMSYLVGLTYLAKQENLNEIANLWPLLLLGAPLAIGAYLARGEPITWVFVLLLALNIGYALHRVRRREPGDIPGAVATLIAGICLLDAIFAAGTGAWAVAWICVGGFVLTKMLQTKIAGT